MCFFQENKPPCTCAFRQLVQPCWRATFYPSPNDNPNPIVLVCGVMDTAAGAGLRYCYRCEVAAALAQAKAAVEATRPGSIARLEEGSSSSLSTTSYYNTCYGQGGESGTISTAVDKNNNNNVLCSPTRNDKTVKGQQRQTLLKRHLAGRGTTSRRQPYTPRSVPEHWQESAPGPLSNQTATGSKPIVTDLNLNHNIPDLNLDLNLNIDDLLTTVNFDDPGKLLPPYGDVPSLVSLDADGASDPRPWTTESWMNTINTSAKQ